MGSGLAFGVVAVALSLASTRYWCRRWTADARGADRLEAILWAAYLGLAAVIYLGFALREAGEGWMQIEWIGLVIYGGLGAAGARRGRTWLIALGWALHAIWDMVVHQSVPDQFVPTWYRWACLSFDVIAAAYLLHRWRRASAEP